MKTNFFTHKDIKIEKDNILRYYPDLHIGLTKDQLESRINDNLVNYDSSISTKSIKQILFENFFTLFNFLNLFLAFAVFSVGSYKNMLFLMVVIINTFISTFQEVRSKKIVDKLSIMASNKTIAIRNGKKLNISIYEIVLDDILEFNTGDQIATDCSILYGEVEVNESFITGESDTIFKNFGDTLLSGSYIVSGKCTAKVEHIGENNFVSKISNGAKYIKKINSEIMKSLRNIIKFLTFAIIPIGVALFYSQFYLQNMSLTDSVVKTVAAVIGMIPEGLVLLTSTVLAVSVIRMSKSKVLVQELYCIETLARVDTLCLDKTGTLTEGCMEVKDYIPISISKKDMENILSNIAFSSDDNNSTIEAIKNKFLSTNEKWISNNKVPFSSKNKWSGINFKDKGTYIIGAPEFVLKKQFKSFQNEINYYSKDYRVLVLAHSNENFENKNIPSDINLIGFILILDKIRKEAKQTLKYFKEQGVEIKIISGDNPITVSKIAKQVGLETHEKYIDMSSLNPNSKIDNIALEYSVFGRVSPTQKESLILALQKKGKTVAMTGDGVNDVLALKASDCSIAMANGSDATKNISQLILLDSNFASLPKIVAEGRRTINNIQRSASLFLVKTIYSSILALMFLFMGDAYPFIPIQLSLISTITIGIPSLFLALEPNKERIQGHFLQNVISKALPTGITVSLNIFALAILHKYNQISADTFSSLCVISTGICGIILLFTLSKTKKDENLKLPFSPFRLTLSIILSFLFIIGLTIFNDFFNIIPIFNIITIIIRIIIISLLNFIILNILFEKRLTKIS